MVCASSRESSSISGQKGFLLIFIISLSTAPILYSTADMHRRNTGGVFWQSGHSLLGAKGMEHLGHLFKSHGRFAMHRLHKQLLW